MRVNNIDKAIFMLKEECHVVPEKYTKYNGAYLFLAYPPDVKDKECYMNPYFLVDVKRKLVGPFSPAFDFNGFFKAVENMEEL